ncbi:DSD1 family PLP-dependent enzyme [Ottowia sp.]|uniref:DSD1 family PLP-dependent enzyme n=1 Tax=Ottowia sp. TaxID=1898956 RepID=UPI003A8B3104
MRVQAKTIPSALSALVGHSVDSIDTPTLVVDLDAANRNMQRMAEFTARRGLRLRPHGKMHKSAMFARLQLQAGAIGLCTQTVGEAEALAAGGINDVFISNEIVSPSKLHRVAALAHQLKARGGQLALAVDSAEGVARLAQAMHLTNAAIDVFVEVDIGQGRCGVKPRQPAVDLVKQVSEHAPSLRYAGLHAYHGGAQHLRSPEERHTAMARAAELVQATCELLRTEGLEPPLVTGAGTGTFMEEAASGVWNEIQPGSFLFMDADYLQNQRGAGQIQFESALFVKSQIISASARHVVCDAGHKSHAIDSGLPLVWSPTGQPQWTFANGGDEHGILHAVKPGGPLPSLGDTVWLIPGHCDPTVNLHDYIVVVHGGLLDGKVQAIVPVDARGV